MNLRFFGDSVCNGQYVSINKTFPCLIANDHPDWTVTVSARNGETTREALARITHDVLKDPPDILYVQFGINDANKWADGMGLNRTSPHSFEANIREIIYRAKAAGIGNIIFGTNHPISKEYEVDSRYTFDEMNSIYNDIIRRVAAFNGCAVVDHHRDWIADGVLPDGIHLSEKGHAAYYQLIKEYL